MANRRERLSEKHFDIMVRHWNSMKPIERRERAEACAKSKHEWVEAPFSGPPSRTMVCKKCLKYWNVDE